MPADFFRRRSTGIKVQKLLCHSSFFFRRQEGTGRICFATLV